MSLRIGIDFGGVCSRDSDNYEDEKKVGAEKSTDIRKGEDEEMINVPGCKEALVKLKELGHHLALVSFCGRKRAEKTSRSTAVTYFDETYFVKNRSYKDDVCSARCLDVMIDDRSDILQTVDSNMITIKFGSHPSDANVDKEYEPDYHVHTWPEVLEVLSQIRPINKRWPVRDVPGKLIYKN